MMNKKVKELLFVLLSTLTTVTHAQISSIDLGFEAGLSRASLRGNVLINSYHHSRIGWHSGITSQFNFGNVIAVRSGLDWERKGSTFAIPGDYTTSSNNGTLHGEEIFDYITIPILARATFGVRLNYFFSAGVYSGFLLRQMEYTEAFDGFPEATSVRTGYYKRNELGVVAGAGISYPLSELIIVSCEVRNHLGLTDINRYNVSNEESIKTNVFNFLFGVCYKLEY